MQQPPSVLDRVSVIIDGDALLAAGYNTSKTAPMIEFHQKLVSAVYSVVGTRCSTSTANTLERALGGGGQHNQHNNPNPSLSDSFSFTAAKQKFEGGFSPDIFCFFSSSFLETYHSLSKKTSSISSTGVPVQVSRPTNNYSITDAFRRLNYQCTILEDANRKSPSTVIDGPTAPNVGASQLLKTLAVSASPAVAAAMATKAMVERHQMLLEFLNKKSSSVIPSFVERNHFVVFVGGVELEEGRRGEKEGSSMRSGTLLQALAPTAYELTMEPTNLNFNNYTLTTNAAGGSSYSAHNQLQKQFSTFVDFVGIQDDEAMKALSHSTATDRITENHFNSNAPNIRQGAESSVPLSGLIPSIPLSDRPPFVAAWYSTEKKKEAVLTQGGGPEKKISNGGAPSTTKGAAVASLINDLFGEEDMQPKKQLTTAASIVPSDRSNDQNRNEPKLQSQIATQQAEGLPNVSSLGSRKTGLTENNAQPQTPLEAAKRELFKRLYALHLLSLERMAVDPNMMSKPKRYTESELQLQVFCGRPEVSSTASNPHHTSLNTISAVVNAVNTNTQSLNPPPSTEPLYATLLPAVASHEIYYDSATYKRHYFVEKDSPALGATTTSWGHPLGPLFTKYLETQSKEENQKLIINSLVQVATNARSVGGAALTVADCELVVVSRALELLPPTLTTDLSTAQSSSSGSKPQDDTYNRNATVAASAPSAVCNTMTATTNSEISRSELTAPKVLPSDAAVEELMAALAAQKKAIEEKERQLASVALKMQQQPQPFDQPQSQQPKPSIAANINNTALVDELFGDTNTNDISNSNQNATTEIVMSNISPTDDGWKRSEGLMNSGSTSTHTASRGTKFAAEALLDGYQYFQPQGQAMDDSNIMSSYNNNNNNYSQQSRMRSTGQNLVEDLLTKATPKPAAWVPPPQSSAAPTTTMNPATQGSAHSVTPSSAYPVSANNHPAWMSNNNTQMGTTTTGVPNIPTFGTQSTPQPSSAIPNIVLPGNKMMTPTTESPPPTIDANAVPPTPRRSNIPNLVIGGIRMPTAASEIKPQPLLSPVVAPMQQQGMGSAGYNKSMPTAPLTTPTKGMQGPPQPSNEVNGVLAAGQHTAAPLNNSVAVSTPRVAGTSSMTSHPLGNSTSSSMPGQAQRIGQQHPTLAQFASSNTVKNTAWGPSSALSASPSPSAPSSLNNRSAMQNQQTTQIQQLSTSAAQRPPNAGNVVNTAANDVTSQVGGPTEADADRIRASLPKGWDCQLFVKEGRPNRIVYIDHERKTTSWERPTL